MLTLKQQCDPTSLSEVVSLMVL